MYKATLSTDSNVSYRAKMSEDFWFNMLKDYITNLELAIRITSTVKIYAELGMFKSKHFCEIISKEVHIWITSERITLC